MDTNDVIIQESESRRVEARHSGSNISSPFLKRIGPQASSPSKRESRDRAGEGASATAAGATLKVGKSTAAFTGAGGGVVGGVGLGVGCVCGKGR